MKIINIGILAHVDAGKTTLTESLLYTSGAILELGSVDKGTTRTDTMFLERQRGITIQAAVTSFNWNDYKINIVDTPGHTDFITEVYRSLSVLDGAILVISAKDGVQAQTRILFHALQKMNIPTIIFINKITDCRILFNIFKFIYAITTDKFSFKSGNSIGITAKKARRFIFFQYYFIVFNEYFNSISVFNIQIFSDFDRKNNSSKLVHSSYDTCRFHIDSLLLPK